MKGGFFVFVKNLLFPIFCVQCGQEGDWLCDKCLDKIKFDDVCSDLPTKDLDGLVAMFDYKKQIAIQKLIHNFKYGFAKDIIKIWKILFIRFSEVFLKNVDASFVVVPVPLHPRRERERGFNQAQILAEALSEAFGLQILNKNLVRVRYTAQQAKLSGESRQSNLKNAFVWKAVNKSPVNILLVDDVFTTGTTLYECAKILKQNGAKKIWGFVLARRRYIS